jgi:predicted DNA-binding protein
MPLNAGMAATATRNLHVPLSEPLHDRLRAEAARSGRPATTLAREAIEAWIEERERHAVHDAIVEYAGEMAGSPADLDEDLERASVEHLVAGRRRKR